MANTGLQYLVCARADESDTAVTYTEGMVMAYAIKADMSIEINEAKLYADNRMVENAKEFKSGKVTINADHLTYDVLALITGHTVTTESDGSIKLVAKAGDDGAFVGVGFYADSTKNNVKGYRAFWLHKVKFGIPNESLETKGENITFQTPTIEGTILADRLGVWKTECTFTDEAPARQWLAAQAGITEG